MEFIWQTERIIMNWLITQSVSWCLGAHLLTSSVPYQATITKIACTQHVNPTLVAAIIEKESGFHRRKRRVEPAIHDISRGLMQITLGTARMMGFRGAPEKLYSPMVNIRYGVRYLAYLLKRYPTGEDAIAAYNDGHPHFRRGHYVNSKGGYSVQRYVSDVLRNTKNLMIASVNSWDFENHLGFIGEQSPSLNSRWLLADIGLSGNNRLRGRGAGF